MKIVFYAPDGAGDKQLVAAVMAGAERHGDRVEFVPVGRYDGVRADADAAACYGVRASTRIILDAYRRAGKRTLFFDKGYWGRGRYTRVAVDAWHPTAYFQCRRPEDRLQASRLRVCDPWLAVDYAEIIYAATTQTWCDFYDLGPARKVDELVVRMLRAAAKQYCEGDFEARVVYRPRPAYAKKHPELARPIEGAVLSDPEEPLSEALKRCRRLVTLGSNAAIEALAGGVPTLVLVDGPAMVFNDEQQPGLTALRQFFADLAYTQWTLDEYLSGEAWAEIRERLQ